ncbi:DNA excision repair protein ERCC-6-like [Mytilus californianus]|uniref:DNA excision repair protein ERCC-6-like n=1 Tax=Mytilus californianus TaxID=6549 RepID=UPI002246959D|nr:DNA excision repair protein ERCC-6-like [Mytilus californianus]
MNILISKMEKKIISGHLNEPSAMETDQHQDSTEKEKAKSFHVNRDLIPVAHLDDQAFDELKNLGLDVFNQEDFEEGVMAQVGEVLAKEEEDRNKKVLEKDLRAVEFDIKNVEKELKQVTTVLSSLNTGVTSAFVQKRLLTVKKQKENKSNQLMSLKAKEKSLKKKLGLNIQESEEEEEGEITDNSPDLNKVLGLSKAPSDETEQERMIRTGEMTPFGTIVPADRSPDKKTNTREERKMEAIMKAFEKMDKNQRRKRESLISKLPRRDSSEIEEDSKKIFPDTKGRRKARSDEEGSLSPSKSPRALVKSKSDGAMDKRLCKMEDLLDDEVCDDEGDEYKPDFKEQSESEDSGLDNTEKKKKLKKRIPIKPRRPPKYIDSDDEKVDKEEGGKQKLSREKSLRTTDDGDDYSFDKRIRDFNKAERKKQDLRAAGELSESEEDEEMEGGFKVPGRIWSKLFKYQKVGVKWLWELHCQQAGGIIGDEMGLGKTIQAIGFLAGLRQSKIRDKHFLFRGLGPTIIVTPTTVMHQWVKEFHKWWPLFRVAILHSSGSYTCKEAELIRTIVKENGVLVTSYSTLVIHQELIISYNWHYIILDEGHKIRNPDAQATLAVKQIKSPHRIILSGSPIQNNLKELWSLFDFIFPGKLGTLPDFMAHFAVPIVQGGYSNASQQQVQTAYKCACVLRDTINPYMIRRMKADLKINLPSKNEQVLFCRLTQEQRETYMEYLQSRECQSILSGKYQIFSGLITLRKICNHPDICTGGPKLYIGETPGNDESLEYGYYKRSGKMIVVEALLRLWKKQGHKVLLFSQSTVMLDILERFVAKPKYSYLRMDGSTPISTRQPLVNQFNKDDSIFLFLLTTRVGGLGVNLTGANRVIIFDPDWNPSTDTQARERTWRIGQTRQVTVYRLVTTGTIEEKIYHRQIFKQFLTNRVLKDPKQRRFFKANDLYELFDLNVDCKEGTETGALFAGTGSEVSKADVRRRVKQHKLNRFDLMKERQKAQKESESKETAKDEDDMDDVKKNFNEDEVNRMKEIAKRLSQQIMTGMFKKPNETTDQNSIGEEKSEENSNGSVLIKENLDDIKNNVVDCGEECSESKQTIDLSPKHSGIVCDDEQPSTSKTSLSVGSKTTSMLKEMLIAGKQSDLQTHSFSTSERQHKHSSSSVGHHKSHRGRTHSHSNAEGKHKVSHGEHKHSESHGQHKHSQSHGKHKHSLSNSPHKHRHSSHKESKHSSENGKDRHRKDKKRRRKDAKCEGERIPNLVKSDTYTPAADEEEEIDREKEHAAQDDYVLQKLFKKNGIQGALKHDVIMDPSKHDYMIVEAEADRVATEAVKALKRSRSQCLGAMSGVPNWTGQHGTMAKKPRFGQKKNTQLLETVVQTTSSDVQKMKKIEKGEFSGEKSLFDGTKAGSVVINTDTGSSAPEVMTSDELLTRMRRRNVVSGNTTATTSTGAENDEVNQQDDDSSTPIVDDDSFKLITEIRNFIMFECHSMCKAMTQEILDEFGPRLPPAETAKFKSMLKSICDFEKVDGIGYWKLKNSFR